MTTIAYRNGILAADTQADGNGWTFETPKIKRLADGRLLAAAGTVALIQEMYAWVEVGADPEKFPAAQRTEKDWEAVLVVQPDGKLLRYERSPYPVEIRAPYYAAGSGRDYALMAMRLGKSAPEAVQLASEFDVHTGHEVETLAIKQPLEEWRRHRLESYPGHGMAGPILSPRVSQSGGAMLQRQFFQDSGGKVPDRA